MIFCQRIVLQEHVNTVVTDTLGGRGVSDPMRRCDKFIDWKVSNIFERDKRGGKNVLTSENCYSVFRERKGKRNLFMLSFII